MEQDASQCCGGFLRQLLQETTGRLEQGCGTIRDAYIHYYYKLQVTFDVASPSRRDAEFTYDLTTERISRYIL